MHFYFLFSEFQIDIWPIEEVRHYLQSLYFAFHQTYIYFYFLKIKGTNKTQELITYNRRC